MTGRGGRSWESRHIFILLTLQYFHKFRVCRTLQSVLQAPKIRRFIFCNIVVDMSAISLPVNFSIIFRFFGPHYSCQKRQSQYLAASE
ncbi:hypothetical protein IW262DRAFT_1481366 [Armillaria fumosa]|nr:hypothetical protein IW262DRAFT_1481366 [Armillaria fumosa]